MQKFCTLKYSVPFYSMVKSSVTRKIRNVQVRCPWDIHSDTINLAGHKEDEKRGSNS